MPSTPPEPNHVFFLSCVSKEFHNGGDHGPIDSGFESCRTRLSNDLGSAGFKIAHQEEFAPSGGGMLEKLDDYIKDCRAVIHLVGDMTGSSPVPDEVRALFVRHPHFLAHREDLKKAVGDGTGISYTQWEALLAIHHRRPCFVFRPAPDLPKGPDYVLDAAQKALQTVHWDRLRGTGRAHESFSSAQHLTIRVFIGLHRERLISTLPSGIIPQNLPFISIGSLFKGRSEFLKQLHAALRVGNQAAAITQTTTVQGANAAPTAIHALGGQGKTRAAVEYAWQHQSDYTALLFARASSPEDLQKNLAALCDHLPVQLSEAERTNDPARFRAALRWLEGNAEWLLILDNVDTLEAANAVRELLPRLHRGRVVITSRIANWDGGVKGFDLSVLPPDAGRDFILEATQNRRTIKPDDAEQAAGISADAGHLALAVQQAAAYVNRRRISLAQYRKDWQEKRASVLEKQKVDKDTGKSLPDYSMELLTTWETTRQQMSVAAQALLDQLAWMAAEPIPRSFVAELKLPEGAEAEEALLELMDWHFAEPATDSDTVQVHAMVQEITRRRLQEEGRTEEALSQVVEALVRVSDVDVGDVRNWPLVEPLRAHLAEGAMWSERCGKYAEAVVLWNRAGRLLLGRALYKPAEELFRKAVLTAQNHLGQAAPLTATILNNLAQLLDDTNRHAEAEPLMRRALAIDEAFYGADHPEVAVKLNNLAGLLQTTNRHGEAEPLMRRALAIDEASFGADHPEVAIRLSNLSHLLQATNRLAEAEPLIRRALAIDEASFGANHPNVAIRLGNLSHLLYDTKRYAEAEPLKRRALAIDEASFGAEYPIVAIRLNNLASLLQATNRHAEAEPLMRRALAVDGACFGADHPNVAIRLNNLASLLQATNRHAEAEPLMRRHLGIFLRFQAAAGHRHPHINTAVDNYAGLCITMNIAPDEFIDRLDALADEAGLGRDALLELLQEVFGQAKE